MRRRDSLPPAEEAALEKRRAEADRRRTRISNRVIGGLVVAAGLIYVAGEIFGF